MRGKDAGRLDITGRRLLGAAFVPEERLGHGAAPRMRLSENLLLSRHATDGKAFVGAAGADQERARSTGPPSASSATMDVRKSARDPEAARAVGRQSPEVRHRPRARPPSGGAGRQPADLGRRRRRRGAGSGSRSIELARSGSAVLVISQDLDEIFEISDAIAVMHNGELSQAAADRRSDAREDRPADGRRGARPRRSGGGDG